MEIFGLTCVIIFMVLTGICDLYVLFEILDKFGGKKDGE